MAPSPTAQKIIEAARRFLHEEGADAVTMRRVAKAVGITPMAVYRHYADRACLLNALADDGFDELAARLANAPCTGEMEARLTRILNIFLKHALENPRLFELMFLKPREGARRYPHDFKAGRSPTANPAAGLIREGMESGYFRKDDAWEISFAMGALLQGLIMLYLGGRMAISEVRFRALCHRSLRRYINGLRS
jgi:AcrR family transcriptional regulator